MRTDRHDLSDPLTSLNPLATIESQLAETIQAQILNLLKDLQEQLNLTYLFISHDMPVMRQMCDRIGVMRQGKLIEISETEALFESPRHNYTRSLIELMPKFARECDPPPGLVVPL